MTVLAATQTLALGPDWLDPAVIIESLGPWALVGVAAIIFAECGLLLGFFLPGDSLLFTAGLFVASGSIGVPLWLVGLILVVAAFVGNAIGYGIGYRAGPAIFDKPKSRLFNPKHVEKTHDFFEKYGNRAIVLGRFVPIVRTFITVSAGVARMDPKRYLTYSMIGGIAWAAGVTVLGYFLGQFTFVRENIDLILVAIVLVSVLPIVVEVLRARAATRKGEPTPDVRGALAAGAAAATVPGATGEGDPGAVTTRMAAVPATTQHPTATPQPPADQQPPAPQQRPAGPQGPSGQPGPSGQAPGGQQRPTPQRPAGPGPDEPPYRHSSGRPVMGRPDHPGN
ncbi:DedA family protein [Pseudonocardia nantongensis]|uniref:DedA family protein n=1 Tax=Pseudonocardia nantongensis TaxID=1181885 RepID=UPI00397DA22D